MIMIMIDDRMMNDVCMKVNAFQQEQLQDTRVKLRFHGAKPLAGSMRSFGEGGSSSQGS